MSKNTHEEYFINAYVKEIYQLEHVYTYKKKLRTILDSKY